MKKYKFKVTAENSAGTVSKTFTLNVKAEKPAVTTYSLPYGVMKTPYNIKLEADGTEPITWSKSGKFPSGLKLVSKTGEITGKPTKAGTYNFTVKAKNKGGTDAVSMQMVIYSEEPASNGTLSASDFSAMSSPITSIENEHRGAELYVISGDEEIDNEVTVEPGMPITFGIMGWTDEYGYEVDSPDVEILIDGTSAEGIEISEDGTFILPAEYVNGIFTVSARTVSGDAELSSEVVTIRTEKAEAEMEDTEESENAVEIPMSSSAGCDSGFAGLLLISLLVVTLSKKK